MVLATHIVAGAAVAKPFILSGHPVLGFAAAIASHYILDQFPHWQYEPRSVSDESHNRMNVTFSPSLSNFLHDGALGLSDVFLGFLLVYLSSGSALHVTSYMICGFAGALPDTVQVIYAFYKKWPIKQLKQFAVDHHGKHNFKLSLPSTASQIIVMIISILVLI